MCNKKKYKHTDVLLQFIRVADTTFAKNRKNKVTMLWVAVYLFKQLVRRNRNLRETDRKTLSLTVYLL